MDDLTGSFMDNYDESNPRTAGQGYAQYFSVKVIGNKDELSSSLMGNSA